MESEMKCPKCGQREKAKSEFHRGKQRYKCKSCGCNYTGEQRGYPDYIKLQAVKYYFGENNFKNRL